MMVEPVQCPYCGYLLNAPSSTAVDGVCPVCRPDPVPEHVTHERRIALWPHLVLALGKDGAVVREARVWEERDLLEEDIRPLLLRMEEDGEIERYGGYYRVLATQSDAAA